MSLIACLQFLSLTLSCRCDVFVTVQQWATQQGTTPSSSSILCSLILSSFNICYVPFLLIDFIQPHSLLVQNTRRSSPSTHFQGDHLCDPQWRAWVMWTAANIIQGMLFLVLLLFSFSSFSLLPFSLYAFNNHYSQMASSVPVMHFIEDDNELSPRLDEEHIVPTNFWPHDPVIEVDTRKPDLKELVRMGYPPFNSISLIHRSLLILPSPPVYLLLFLQAQKKTSGTAPHALFSSSYDTIYETSIGKDQQYCWFRHHFHAVPR